VGDTGTGALGPRSLERRGDHRRPRGLQARCTRSATAACAWRWMRTRPPSAPTGDSTAGDESVRGDHQAATFPLRPLGSSPRCSLHANPDQNTLGAWAGNLGEDRVSRAWAGPLRRRAHCLRQRLARGQPQRLSRPLLRGDEEDQEERRPGLAARARSLARERASPLHPGRRLRLFRGTEKGPWPGKRADLVVVSEDIFKGAPEAS
jgi:hypothetical protein